MACSITVEALGHNNRCLVIVATIYRYQRWRTTTCQLAWLNFVLHFVPLIGHSLFFAVSENYV